MPSGIGYGGGPAAPGAPGPGGYGPTAPIAPYTGQPGWGGPGTVVGQPSPGITNGAVVNSHTSTAAETAFTSVTFTFPRPAIPVTLTANMSAGAGAISIVLTNQTNLYVATSINTIATVPLTGIFPTPQNAIAVGFECISGVATITAVVAYQ